MLTALAIENYRSIRSLKLPLDKLTVITGANGSGKSNLYRALRLLANTAQGGVVSALASEGGLASTMWAGPDNISRRMRSGEVAVEGSHRKSHNRLMLGFASDEYSYAIAMGMPEPVPGSVFNGDPEVKQEAIWAGEKWRPAAQLVSRQGPVVKSRQGRNYKVISQHLPAYDSMFDQVADYSATPELFMLREQIRQWRFYDHFRTDRDAPARQSSIGTRTPVLHHDGRDLAAAIQTIREVGDDAALEEALDNAFPGSTLDIGISDDNRFTLSLQQPGMLRPLSAAELSDGTLRYLLLTAALLTPRPPELMVLNEPETSLHPDLLPALGKLIIKASEDSQIWVISHAPQLIRTLESYDECHSVHLHKPMGATEIPGQGILDEPGWQWPSGF
ncbi:AAA family ATPase [Oceanospirillum sediminis]|uniref:AAA family ATPase n=1 Tax=Oceanospirillum sediminis TaxID=2760088 RepID=A0A839IW01_9GAMM|nr:AAA family ATPase [Oceanospirillum sediminis]MBB1488557.1 AAA family ATPase [Oceanospirillum sediminis]